jgi:hypothetical protein
MSFLFSLLAIVLIPLVPKFCPPGAFQVLVWLATIPIIVMTPFVLGWANPRGVPGASIGVLLVCWLNVMMTPPPGAPGIVGNSYALGVSLLIPLPCLLLEMLAWKLRKAFGLRRCDR